MTCTKISFFKTKKNEYENNIDFEKYRVFEKIFHKLRTEI